MLRKLPESESPFKHNPNLVPEHVSREESYDLLCKIEDVRSRISADRRSLEGMGVQFPIT